MFLKLDHTKLDVYVASQNLVLNCYKMTKLLPPDEKFAMIQQVRRAALSVHLNLAEGCSRKSKKERSRYYEVSRGSIVEIDACLDVAVALKYVSFENLKPLGESMVSTFRLLSGMIN